MKKKRNFYSGKHPKIDPLVAPLGCHHLSYFRYAGDMDFRRGPSPRQDSFNNYDCHRHNHFGYIMAVILLRDEIGGLGYLCLRYSPWAFSSAIIYSNSKASAATSSRYLNGVGRTGKRPSNSILPNVSGPEISATDYPQYLGQHRNGVISTTKLNLDWESSPPKLVWRRTYWRSVVRIRNCR